jgi:hypothetical protein
MQVLQRGAAGRYAKEKSIGLLLSSIPGARKTQNSRLPIGSGKDGKVNFKRCTGYYLPSLQKCREWFDSKADWDEQADWVHEVIIDGESPGVAEQEEPF